MNDNILEIKDLNVFHKKEQLLYNISLSIKNGASMGLIGLSGSGKTTLARTILGLIKADSGSIALNTVQPMMVFQDPYSALNKVKKIGWLLEEPLRLKLRDKAARRAKAEEMLLDIGLNEAYYDRYPMELSGGERQRVCIGIALITGSRFIILDEATSSLDVTVQSRILELLDKLKKRHSLTYLFISHDINVICRICDSVAVIDSGRIIEQGSIRDVFGNPQNEFTGTLLKAAMLEV